MDVDKMDEHIQFLLQWAWSFLHMPGQCWKWQKSAAGFTFTPQDQIKEMNIYPIWEMELLEASFSACVYEGIPVLYSETEQIIHLAVRRDSRFLLFGPASPVPVQRDELMQYAAKHHIETENIRIPVLEATELIRFTSMMTYLLTGIFYSQHSITLFLPQIKDVYSRAWLQYRLIEDLHLDTWEMEEKWQAMISAGVYEAEPVEEGIVGSRVGILAKDSYKNIEYRLVSAISLACRAAIRGGLDPNRSYEISDIHMQELAECSTVQEMNQVYFSAMKDFAHQVRYAREAKERAGLTEKCKSYIAGHLDQPLSVQEIAGELDVTPNHLSARFSRDTGQHITEYIREKRLDRAEEMLIYSNMPIVMISEKLYFSSQSYFTRLFHHRFGMTPQKYRDRYGVHTGTKSKS